MVVYKSVYVLSRHGRPLMPCSPRKARLLLKQGKAKVIKRTPFTIQLLYGSGTSTQPIILGVDTGYEHIGLSATTRKSEVLAVQVNLRSDLSNLLSERKEYRISRRHRKTRYRETRFLNRVKSKPKGWLAPSIQHKLDSHLRLVQKIMTMLPLTQINIEVAKFDIQKIKNPNIKGKQYQEGEQLGFENVKVYVRHRDNHTCQHCKGKTKDPILEIHHLVPKSQGGSDRPDNLITLCKTCHDKVTRGLLKLKVGSSRGFRAETFMNIIRRKLVDKLQKSYNNINATYGYITKAVRQELELSKSHINDAFVISGGTTQIHNTIQYLVRQVRKQNRKLFKGKRSETLNIVPRYLFGFQRFDKVKFNRITCFIFGRRRRGYFCLAKLDGKTFKPEPSYKRLRLLESFTTFLWEI